MGEYDGKVFDKGVWLTEHGFKITLCCLLSYIQHITQLSKLRAV